jgi:hypothetical protein
MVAEPFYNYLSFKMWRTVPVRCFRLVGVAALLFFFCLPPAWAQRGPIRNSGVPDKPSEQELAMQRNARRQLQRKRYADMKRDSQKLLELATELKQYVDKTGENILSMDVVRKAEEMEKLARQVKNNMRAE